jgi:uncharacterized protein (DUF608 family)
MISVETWTITLDYQIAILESFMSISRRKFLANSAAASGAVLAASRAFPAPYQVSVQRDSGATFGAGKPGSASDAPVAIPATMPMGSGAPLGGIGTGFVEIRPDGCFYEWQIFNSGPWAQNARSTTAPPPPGPEYLRFVLRTKKASDPTPQIRKLYLRADESDVYTLPFVQDVQAIDYSAWFPMTSLRYRDDSIPVQVSAQIFSPFIPSNARDSATPGFHVVYTLENVSKETTEVALAGFLDNPLASALSERRLTNTLLETKDNTSIFFETAAQCDFPSGIGNLCLSVTGGDRSYINGTFKEYALPGNCRWNTTRVNYMVLDVLQEFAAMGKLPNSAGSTDPSLGLLTDSEIDALSSSQVQKHIKDLSSDALLARVFNDARLADAHVLEKHGKEILKEVRLSLLGKKDDPQLTWGTGALASSVRLKPGEKIEIRFTLSWYFPHHLTVDGREMGHMYANWYKDAADVNRFLCANYNKHRAATEAFARTLADTSLGNAMAFSWSGQLSTLVFNTWWTKDNGYAIWEGLGCCGLSTTDVDYQGSFPVLALFPELKLSQMKRIIAHQNALGQVPHNYPGDVDQVDSGFARVDMNSQFVMMVCRDYMWTGDKEYLDVMWPHVVKAMAFTESLDTNGDALPDRDTGLQTYDQWSMRGTPAYIASLWIGALRAAIHIANDAQRQDDAQRWSNLLKKASASFDSMLFNGEYYSLWVDGRVRNELCMTDQLSGEWFTGLIGLPTTISKEKLDQAIGSIFKCNFNAEFGVHNATAPRKGPELLALTNLQAGGLWSGIEFAFASLLMDHGRYTDGVKVVEAIHRRYLRAGQPWNHVECGGHYSRAMSSWATLLAATGFKPDLPHETLEFCPRVQGDFHAPWVTATGFGTIRSAGGRLSISCVHGALEFRSLRVNSPVRAVRMGTPVPATRITAEGKLTLIEFAGRVSLPAGEALTIL